MSSHFALGTYVVMNYQRGKIIDISIGGEDNLGVYLRILWDNGSVSHVKPFALNR